MYHVGLRTTDTKPKIDYSNLPASVTKETPQIPSDDTVPTAPDGFTFYRIQSGDTLVSLSVRFGVSQNKIRRYNSKVCFGHRLTHIIGKLLLIPMDSTANLTAEIKEQLTKIYMDDNNERLNEDNTEQKFTEPDENGKYQLRKALMFHAKGIDEQRADYYLGEANWNVRKALNIWRGDDKWEKKHTIITQCKLNEEEATQLLENYNWNMSEAIRFWKSEQKKMAKINKKLETAKGNQTTEGAMEMQTVKKYKDEKYQNLVSEDNDTYNNIKQGSLTSGVCCGN